MSFASFYSRLYLSKHARPELRRVKVVNELDGTRSFSVFAR